MSEKIIEINHLRKSFGENEVLKDISMTINKGEVVTIIGSSGSGKSTLLRCINLLEKPTGGEIVYNGDNVLSPKYNLPKYRTNVGMVFQSFNLFNNMNVLENCISGQTTVLKRSKEEARKVALENLEKVGMERYIEAKPSQLSGGQKQRISIARALIQSPELLILDDALSAVDAKTEEAILHNLKEERKNKTTIIAAHRLSSVMHANEIVVIDKGRIVERGTHQELLALGGWYEQMWEKQQLEAKIEGGEEDGR